MLPATSPRVRASPTQVAAESSDDAFGTTSGTKNVVNCWGIGDRRLRNFPVPDICHSGQSVTENRGFLRPEAGWPMRRLLKIADGLLDSVRERCAHAENTILSTTTIFESTTSSSASRSTCAGPSGDEAPRRRGRGCLRAAAVRGREHGATTRLHRDQGLRPAATSPVRRADPRCLRPFGHQAHTRSRLGDPDREGSPSRWARTPKISAGRATAPTPPPQHLLGLLVAAVPGRAELRGAPVDAERDRPHRVGHDRAIPSARRRAGPRWPRRWSWPMASPNTYLRSLHA
jgi:hypothetical protein